MENTKSIVIMCNGKSILDADFERLRGVSTFGLNMAYKWYYKNDWWPTYHGGFDYVNNTVFEKQHIKMMEDNNPIKRFFYVQKYKTNSPRFTHINLKKSIGWNNSTESFKKFYHFGNSGTNACSVAVALGYKNIILLGADNTHIEKYDGIGNHSSGSYIMTHTPKDNPNYWFNYYLEKGERVNKPNKHKYHTPWWPKFKKLATKNGIRVVNCSYSNHKDGIKCFEISDINTEMERLGI